MTLKMRTTLLCLCIVTQQLLCGAGVAPPGYSNIARRSASTQEEEEKASRNWEMWNDLKTNELKTELLQLEHQLRSSPAYGLIKSFIETSECDEVKYTGHDLPGKLAGDTILTSLSKFALMVGKGCPQEAIDAARLLIGGMTKTFPFRDVVDNKNCSLPADESIKKMFLKNESLLKVYTLISGGTYSSVGCKSLASNVLPDVVQYSYKIADVEKKAEPLLMFKNDQEKIDHSIADLQKLKKEISQRISVPSDRRKRAIEDGETCEKSWESSIYKAVEPIPIINALWQVGSAIGYGISGCTSVAAERGKSAVSNLAVIFTTFFSN